MENIEELVFINCALTSKVTADDYLVWINYMERIGVFDVVEACIQ